jgi:hypothetical protein
MPDVTQPRGPSPEALSSELSDLGFLVFKMVSQNNLFIKYISIEKELIHHKHCFQVPSNSDRVSHLFINYEVICPQHDSPVL